MLRLASLSQMCNQVSAMSIPVIASSPQTFPSQSAGFAGHWCKQSFNPTTRHTHYIGQTLHCLPSHLQQHRGKVTVIDNYDSFTYNLSQVQKHHMPIEGF